MQRDKDIVDRLKEASMYLDIGGVLCNEAALEIMVLRKQLDQANQLLRMSGYYGRVDKED